jgi:secondary thiamine-phosphate synthase enzyme
MIAAQEALEIATRGRGLVNVTAEIERVVRASGIASGLCVVFVQHTSASLVIQENADPAVLRDLERFIARVAPEGSHWEHDAEGPDDMPAHARSALTKTTETIPVTAGQLALGTWQGIYLWEHRTRPHRRRLVVHVQGVR